MIKNESMLTKNALCASKIAKLLLNYDINEKTPTISELCILLDTGRGTVQTGLEFLKSINAITIKSKGQLGSFLIKKNMNILLEVIGISSIVGVMPLPYSKRYEGLATGLIKSLENKYNLPASLAYMRGATNRIEAMLSGRYDFAIISKTAAEKRIEFDDDIVILFNLGPQSYVSNHVVLFKDKSSTSIKDGMKVGIDSTSIDQIFYTNKLCKGKKIEYVNVEYSNVSQEVKKGRIDAAIWNKDEILDKNIDINYIEIDDYDTQITNAVIIVKKDNNTIKTILEDLIDIEKIRRIQNDVIKGIITPRY